MKTNKYINDFRHHDQSRGVQSTFQYDVTCLIHVLEERGSPFIVLIMKNAADAKVVKTVQNIQHVGHDLYASFMSEQLQDWTTNLMHTIKKKTLPLFQT